MGRTFRDITIQLRILAEYIHFCKTRVIIQQTVDTTLDILLNLKDYLFSQHFIDELHLDHLELCHELLRVFDIISERNQFLPLNDILLTIFVQKDNTFIARYAITALTSKEFENKMLSPKYLQEIRLQIIKHYCVCVGMIKKQFKQGNLTIRDLIQKMEFLVSPKEGKPIFQQLLTDPKIEFPLKETMLTFLHKLIWNTK